MNRFPKISTRFLNRISRPRVGVTSDNNVIVMYHPKEEYEISYEDTTEIDFSKPKTAEEVGRKLLKLNQLDNVEIENHYHTRTFPAPDGSDVNTMEDLFPRGEGTQHNQTAPIASKLAKIYQSDYKAWELHNWRYQNRSVSNKPGIKIEERDPEK